MGKAKATIDDAFWDKVVLIPESTCWHWIGSKMKSGYGNLTHRQKGKYAHRASWEIHNGKIPVGLWVLHKCDQRDCVNPSHLFLGTVADNNQDMCAKKRQWQQKKSHCVNGHPFDLENTVTTANRPRRCRQCSRVRGLQYKKRHREKYNAYQVLWREKQRALKK